MLKVVEVDLLDFDADIIAHQVNCQGAFNSGVARAIRKYDESIYLKYSEHCKKRSANQLIGTVQYCRGSADNRIFANFFALKYYGYDKKQYTNTEALKKCLINLKAVALDGGYSIALPYKIGCVRGGADWDEVYRMIKEIFEETNIDVTLCKYDKG